MNHYYSTITNSISKEFLGSIIAFIAFTIFYAFLFFLIKKQEWSKDKKIRTSVAVRNVLFFCFLITTFFLWSVEIKTFIFSAAAIVAAFFVAFKEILLSFVGTIISNKSFRVGDFIEYEQIKGKIIDKSFLNTTILISDKYRSKELTFPNLAYITNKLINLSTFGKIQSYSIFFSVENQKDILNLSKKANEIANDVLFPYIENIKKLLSEQKQSEHFFEIPNCLPVISFDLSDFKNTGFKLHFLSLPSDQLNIEEQIYNKYLEFLKEYYSN